MSQTKPSGVTGTTVDTGQGAGCCKSKPEGCDGRCVPAEPGCATGEPGTCEGTGAESGAVTYGTGGVAIPDRRQGSGAGYNGGDERRKSVVDRRAGVDRRAIDIGSPTGLERRRGPGRRRTDDRRSAEEGEMTDEQFEFVLAVDTYKRLNNRPFPTWTEVLEVVKQLGYRKVAASTLTLSAATGRSANAPSNGGAKPAAAGGGESEFMPG